MHKTKQVTYKTEKSHENKLNNNNNDNINKHKRSQWNKINCECHKTSSKGNASRDVFTFFKYRCDKTLKHTDTDKFS